MRPKRVTFEYIESENKRILDRREYGTDDHFYSRLRLGEKIFRLVRAVKLAETSAEPEDFDKMFELANEVLNYDA